MKMLNVMYQFGFKKGHSTGTCTSIVKRTIDNYLKRGSYVFTCFIDFSKAFDRVNFWKLFLQMLEEVVMLALSDY